MDHTQPHRQGETDNGQGTGHEGVSDEALLDRYRAGERLAIRTIIERYHDDLMRFLLRLVGDLAGAEDVFQETFLQVHISLERFDTERRFKPWLFTIAANKARDLLRRRARRFALDLSAPIAGTQGEATYIDLLEVPTEPPGRRLDDEERSVLVQRALDRMPLPLREILLLAYFQRLSYALIADELGIPLGTVKSRLHSAVAAFARRWRDALSEATEAPAPRRAPPWVLDNRATSPRPALDPVHRPSTRPQESTAVLHDPPSQPPPPEPDANGPQLRPADGRAIDQAMQLRFQSLGLHCDDERTRRASDLLALVGAPEISSVAGDALQAQARALRIERVMARLSSFPASTEESPAERQAEIVACSEALHPADDDALWALATAGFDAARVPASLRQRARAHMQLLELAVGPSPNVQRAGLSPVESTQARIQDTLALIDDHDQQRALDTAGSVLHDARTQRAGIRRFRWADVVGIAAMLLVAGSIAIPTLQHVRREAQRFACENNLSSAATAFASYAADHADALPIATAGFGAKPWWNVGDPQGTSNSANLYLLVHQGYIPIDRLACPGNADARRVLPQSQPSLGQPAHDWLADQEVSYSYRLGVSARDALAAGAGAGSVILADRSPIATKNRRGLPAFADENSENHAGRGQMVLMADGSVRWLKTPMLPIDGVSQDNIWLPRQVELLIDRMRASKAMGGTVRLLNGREMPAGPADAFVGP